MTPIFWVWADFKALIRISRFSAIAVYKGKKLDCTCSCYIASNSQPVVQVTSKTSLGLPKVHFRSYTRCLGGLVGKSECPEAQKMAQIEHKCR